MRRLFVLATAAAALLATAAASAQLRPKERRALGADSSQADKAPEQETQYPDATRKEPETKASRKMGPKLQKLFKAYEGEDVATVQALADEIIANEDANAYDKAISARIIGSMLLADDSARAYTYLQQAVGFDGLNNNDHYELMSVLAQLQMQDEKYDEALATIARLQQETNSQKPEFLAMKGNALYRMERYPEAIAALKAATEGVEAPRADWMQLLMAAYSESGQSEEAARLAEEVASRTPGDKQSQLNLAATYLQSEQYDKAAAVYEKLRAAGELTEDRDYRNLMAIYVNSENREKEAIAVINEGLEKGALKGDHNTYVALAQAYYFSEQPGPAIEAYRKAAPLASDGETYLNLARALLNEGRTAEAKQAAQQALDKGLESPDDAKRILAR